MKTSKNPPNFIFLLLGVAEPTRPAEEPEEDDDDDASGPQSKKPKSGAEPAKKPEWFSEDIEKTTKVYVSHLPEQTTEEDFIEFMTKCGMIDIDVRTNQPKIKLYRNPDGSVKGDGLCTYIKVESVQLALQILDGAFMAGSGKIPVKVERAKFEMKGAKYDPKLKPKKLKKKELELLKKKHDKMLAWVPDKMRGERSKRDKVVVIKNLFDPDDFKDAPERILEYSANLRKHCKKFGNVSRCGKSHNF